MLCEEASAQNHFASRVVVMNAMAGGAKLLLKGFMLFFSPLPAPGHIDRPALRAEERRVRLLPRLVGIVHLLLHMMGLDLVAARLLAVKVSCFHVRTLLNSIRA